MYTIKYTDGSLKITDDKHVCAVAAYHGAQVWVTATRKGVYFAG